MTKSIITQITLKRDGYDNYEIADITSLLELNPKINDPYYKTRTIDIGDKLKLDGSEYTVKDINFMLHPLNHIELQNDLEINCAVVVHLV